MAIDLSSIRLIPAKDTDNEFLFQARKESFLWLIERVWGKYDEAFQRRTYAEEMEGLQPDVILYENKPAGCCCLMKREDHYSFSAFFVLPEYQGKGIGTYVLKKKLEIADADGLPVRLRHWNFNPAAALYARMGFREIGRTEFKDKTDYLVLTERRPARTSPGRKYQAIIFDLFGTLVENFPSDEGYEVLSRAALVLGVSHADYNSQWIAAFNERMTGTAENFQACIKNICQRLGLQATEEQIDKAASIRFEMTQREVMSCREGAVETLSYLKKNGCKTGLISNCSSEATRVWPETLLAPLIDAPVFSCVEGIMKPDPRLFQIALKRLNVRAANCLYIADGMSQELATASKLGMQAILLEAPHNNTTVKTGTEQPFLL